MTKPDDTTRVRHMREAGQKIICFTAGRTRQDLDHDEQLTLSLVRLLEIVGEAASKVSAETQRENPAVQEDVPELLAFLDGIRLPR